MGAYKQEIMGNRKQISGSRETLKTNLEAVLTEAQMNDFLAMLRPRHRKGHKNYDRLADWFINAARYYHRSAYR